MSRDHVVSLRFTEQEHVRLAEMAVGRGYTLSRLVRESVLGGVLAPPLPSGESVGSAYRFLLTRDGFELRGVVWSDGTASNEITLFLGDVTHG
jgi:hypothetical protein